MKNLEKENIQNKVVTVNPNILLIKTNEQTKIYSSNTKTVTLDEQTNKQTYIQIWTIYKSTLKEG